MRIALIHLPPDADVPWLLDRLTWAQAPRVLLVCPQGELPGLTGVLPWVRVARAARGQGKSLAVVTRSRRLAGWLREAGIPVFPTVAAAQRRSWRAPRGAKAPGLRRIRRARRAASRVVRPPAREGGTAPSRGARLVAVVLGLGALALLAGFFLPRARIRVPVHTRTRTQAVAVLLSPDFRRAVPAVPGLPLVPGQVTVEVETQVPASGIVYVPTRAAETVLLWTNLTNRALDVPPGLVVGDVAGKVDFYLTEGGHLDPGPGTTVLLKARATRPGFQGNVSAHRLQVVPPPWDLWVTVTNPGPAQGGEEVPLPTPTEADKKQALRRLQERVEREARDRARRQVPEGMVLLPAAPTPLGEAETVLEPRPGTPARVGTVRLRQVYRVWWVPRSALDDLAQALVRARLPEAARVWPGTLQAHLEAVRLHEGPPFRAVLVLSWVEAPRLDPWRLAWQAAGRPITRLERTWSRASWSAGPPQVSTWPQGWPWLPAGFRIQVELVAEPTGRPSAGP